MAKLLLAMVKKRAFKASSKISKAKRGKKEQKSNSVIICKKNLVRNDAEDFDEVRIVLPKCYFRIFLGKKRRVRNSLLLKSKVLQLQGKKASWCLLSIIG